MKVMMSVGFSVKQKFDILWYRKKCVQLKKEFGINQKGPDSWWVWFIWLTQWEEQNYYYSVIPDYGNIS